MQGQTQPQPQTVLYNFEEMPTAGDERTSVHVPIPWQQTPAESQTQRPSLNPASQGTPQQADFVQKPQPKDLPQLPRTESTSLQAGVQRGPPMSLRQAADVAQTQMGNGAVPGGDENNGQEVSMKPLIPRDTRYDFLQRTIFKLPINSFPYTCSSNTFETTLSPEFIVPTNSVLIVERSTVIATYGVSILLGRTKTRLLDPLCLLFGATSNHSLEIMYQALTDFSLQVTQHWAGPGNTVGIRI